MTHREEVLLQHINHGLYMSDEMTNISQLLHHLSYTKQTFLSNLKELQITLHLPFFKTLGLCRYFKAECKTEVS